jgi:hypothetical protein
MSDISWFKFENKDLDFPFYKKNPHVPKWGWIVLLFVVPIGLLLSTSPKVYFCIMGCAVILIPLLYFLKWDYKAIFQKPKAKDVAIAVGLFVGYIVYAIVMGAILEYFDITPTASLIEENSISLMSFLPLIFSIMAEELVKFIPFMFFLRICFKYSNRRKLSVIISMLLVMLFFASLHAVDMKMFLFAIFIQGLGSIFEFVGYIKTKNILISYITHFCTDAFIFSLAIMGLA